MNMVRLLSATGLGLIGLFASTAANASVRYGYCETYAPRQAARVTPVIVIPVNVGGDGLDPDFETYMEAKLGFNLMPMCYSYGGDEAQARKMQAYALAQVKQDMPAILDEGFEAYLAQKYGSGRGASSTSKPNPDRGAEQARSEPAAPTGPSPAELRAQRHQEVEERNRAAQAKYEAELAAIEQAKNESAARQAANRAAAEQALAAHARQMEAHAEQVRMADAANLEYRKLIAKPAGVPNAVYRGFDARDCAAARMSALKGAGTDSGTQFKEVESETVAGGCVVRGWWWSTQKGGSSRQ